MGWSLLPLESGDDRIVLMGGEHLKAVLAAHGSVNQGVGGDVLALVPNPDLTPPCGAEPYLIIGMITRLHATARSARALLGVWKVFILRNCCLRVGTGGGWVVQNSSIPIYWFEVRDLAGPTLCDLCSVTVFTAPNYCGEFTRRRCR
jgi:hypothetical protein